MIPATSDECDVDNREKAGLHHSMFTSAAGTEASANTHVSFRNNDGVERDALLLWQIRSADNIQSVVVGSRLSCSGMGNIDATIHDRK